MTLSTVTTTLLPRNASVSVREAAELCDVHADTIDRHRKAGRYPCAYRDPRRRQAWMIPVNDLVEGGDLDPARVETAQADLAALRESRAVADLREQLIRCEERLSAALARVESLESDKAQAQMFLQLALEGRR